MKSARRLWLLVKAVDSAPFDRAIELARTAEAFLMGSAVDTTIDDPTAVIRNQASQVVNQTYQIRKERVPASPLRGIKRDRLVERLAEGARNAELAGEFGISAKQVQGFRMGCAREIAKRRTRLADKPTEPADQHQHATATASIDEIVRYLRQQDDVVVAQEDGWYLVNGRFRMSVAELAARANRMRRRQQKSAFQIPTAALQFGASSAQKRHPLFWEAALPQRGRNGFRQPTDSDTEGA